MMEGCQIWLNGIFNLIAFGFITRILCGVSDVNSMVMELGLVRISKFAVPVLVIINLEIVLFRGVQPVSIVEWHMLLEI